MERSGFIIVFLDAFWEKLGDILMGGVPITNSKAGYLG
jgi:hypothetical protein